MPPTTSSSSNCRFRLSRFRFLLLCLPCCIDNLGAILHEAQFCGRLKEVSTPPGREIGKAAKCRQKFVRGCISDRFLDLFSRFSNRSSHRFKSFSGAVSFCRHAALRITGRKITDMRLLLKGTSYEGTSLNFSCSQNIAKQRKNRHFPEGAKLLRSSSGHFLGVSQRPLTLILLQTHRDTNGKRIVIQIGAVYTTVCQEEGILLQKYRDRN